MSSLLTQPKFVPQRTGFKLASPNQKYQPVCTTIHAVESLAHEWVMEVNDNIKLMHNLYLTLREENEMLTEKLSDMEDLLEELEQRE